MQMWHATIGTAILLIAVGLYGYFTAETKSGTAFIPAGFGVVIGICGAVASNENRRKHAMHAAAAVALLGLLGGGVMAIRGLLKEPEEGAEGIPLATRMQMLMALVCLGFVVLCVRSFIAARKAREAENAAGEN